MFDYGYFINNWGWFYGNTIECYGNARSNGQFDVHGYSPTVTGQPVYDDVAWNGDVPVRCRRMRLSLTWDHRVLDGAPAAAFLGHVRDLLQQPFRLLV